MNVDVTRTDGAARCSRNERKRRLDSTLGNTIYRKEQVYEEQIPSCGATESVGIALDQR